MFLKIGENGSNFRKTTMLEPFVNKVQDLRAYNSIKKRIQHRRFPVCLEKSLFQSQNMLRIQARRNEKNSGEGGVVGSLS